ncbi:hypothetical protein LCGC14_2806210 [marine sediment metagenome]|uniref:Uncharacterized protein n=1 Tax=marine sediment metagenome TaxID=412755 RepID=A0A0F9BCK3_9ZZZZ
MLPKQQQNSVNPENISLNQQNTKSIRKKKKDNESKYKEIELIEIPNNNNNTTTLLSSFRTIPNMISNTFYRSNNSNTKVNNPSKRE